MEQADKQKIKEELDVLFTIHLNGHEKKFKSSLEDIKRDLEVMTPVQIKSLRRALNAKLQKTY